MVTFFFLFSIFVVYYMKTSSLKHIRDDMLSANDEKQLILANWGKNEFVAKINKQCN